MNDLEVSKHHAEVRPQGPGYAIIDLKSTNGTFVNGQPLSPKIPRLLNAGDAIRIGTTQMTYEARSVPLSKDTVFAPPSPVPPVPPPPPPKPWWRRTREIIAVICAAILILISIIAIPVAISNSQAAAANATATAQANNAAATARASSAAATATAQASNNPARATAIALQNLYSSATSGNPAFNDPLSNNNNGNGWSEGKNVTGSSCDTPHG